MFKKEAEQLQSILKDNCVEIHHIGSTAVKGLKAKPIIDIMPVVFDLNKVDEKIKDFENIAYEYGELKASLALTYPYDNGGYCNGKDDYVKKLERDAVLWYSVAERGL